MAEPRWIGRFLGGVADADADRALLRDSAGHAVMVDLQAGQPLWRSDQPMWPLAVDAQCAFGLVFGRAAPSAAGAAVMALDARNGSPCWQSAPLPWPAWAVASAQAAGLDEASDLYAGWQLAALDDADPDRQGRPGGTADSPLAVALCLTWVLRPAAGGMQRATAAAATAGACSVALADGGLIFQSADSAEVWLEAAEAADSAGDIDTAADAERDDDRPQWAESDDPAVLAQVEWRGMRYALAQRPSEVDTEAACTLVAEAATADRAFGFNPPPPDSPLRRRWRCNLDDRPAPRRQPLPPRPA